MGVGQAGNVQITIRVEGVDDGGEAIIKRITRAVDGATGATEKHEQAVEGFLARAEKLDRVRNKLMMIQGLVDYAVPAFLGLAHAIDDVITAADPLSGIGTVLASTAKNAEKLGKEIDTITASLDALADAQAGLQIGLLKAQGKDEAAARLEKEREILKTRRQAVDAAGEEGKALAVVGALRADEATLLTQKKAAEDAIAAQRRAELPLAYAVQAGQARDARISAAATDLVRINAQLEATRGAIAVAESAATRAQKIATGFDAQATTQEALPPKPTGGRPAPERRVTIPGMPDSPLIDAVLRGKSDEDPFGDIIARAQNAENRLTALMQTLADYKATLIETGQGATAAEDISRITQAVNDTNGKILAAEHELNEARRQSRFDVEQRITELTARENDKRAAVAKKAQEKELDTAGKLLQVVSMAGDAAIKGEKARALFMAGISLADGIISYLRSGNYGDIALGVVAGGIYAAKGVSGGAVGASAAPAQVNRASAEAASARSPIIQNINAPWFGTPAEFGAHLGGVLRQAPAGSGVV